MMNFPFARFQAKQFRDDRRGRYLETSTNPWSRPTLLTLFPARCSPGFLLPLIRPGQHILHGPAVFFFARGPRALRRYSPVCRVARVNGHRGCRTDGPIPPASQVSLKSQPAGSFVADVEGRLIGSSWNVVPGNLCAVRHHLYPWTTGPSQFGGRRE